MSVLILPRRFKSQPQYVAPIDWSNPLTTGLVAAFVFDSQGNVIDRVSGKAYPVTGATLRTGRNGRYLYLDGSGDYINLGVRSIGGVNLFADASSRWSVVTRASLGTSSVTGTFLAKAGSTGANRTFQIYRDATAEVSDPSFYIRGALTHVNWDYNDTQEHQYTVTWDGSAARAWADNMSNSAALSVGTAAQESENIVFGARTGGSGFPLTGGLNYSLFYNRPIAQREALAIYDNFWQLFKARPRKLWAATTGGTTNDLTIAASTQANATSAPSVTQTHVLAVGNATQANTSSAPSVTQTHELLIAASNQANAASDVEISVGAAVDLTISACVQPNTASGGEISQTHVLVISASVQGNETSAVSVTQIHPLTIGDATQANTASGASITAVHELVIGSLSQGNTASDGHITRTQTLTIGNAVQANRASAGAISDGVVVESALTTGIAATISIKKPGIPTGTADWLRTMLEIIIGRRGNKITPPKFQELTFSATPTKSECEALYAYTNKVREAVESIITRFDS